MIVLLNNVFPFVSSLIFFFTEIYLKISCSNMWRLCPVHFNVGMYGNKCAGNAKILSDRRL